MPTLKFLICWIISVCLIILLTAALYKVTAAIIDSWNWLLRKTLPGIKTVARNLCMQFRYVRLPWRRS